MEHNDSLPDTEVFLEDGGKVAVTDRVFISRPIAESEDRRLLRERMGLPVEMVSYVVGRMERG